MLFGVSITSYVMDNLNNMIVKIKENNSHFEETDKLALFIGTLVRFNHNAQLPVKFQTELEKFFNYRWTQNRNMAVSS